MLKNNRYKGLNSVSFVLLILSAICLAWWSAYRVAAVKDFYIGCGQYLKSATEAKTVEAATEQLEKAVAYIEEKGLIKGHTSILRKAKNENVGLWYTGVKESLKSLKKLTPGTTEDRRSKMLIKLRKNLIRNTWIGDRVIIPSGISVFPYNKFLAYEALISLIILIICIIIQRREDEGQEDNKYDFTDEAFSSCE